MLMAMFIWQMAVIKTAARMLARQTVQQTRVLTATPSDFERGMKRGLVAQMIDRVMECSDVTVYNCMYVFR
jgi:hypothetical protein